MQTRKQPSNHFSKPSSKPKIRSTTTWPQILSTHSLSQMRLATQQTSHRISSRSSSSSSQTIGSNQTVGSNQIISFNKELARVHFNSVKIRIRLQLRSVKQTCLRQRGSHLTLTNNRITVHYQLSMLSNNLLTQGSKTIFSSSHSHHFSVNLLPQLLLLRSSSGRLNSHSNFKLVRLQQLSLTSRKPLNLVRFLNLVRCQHSNLERHYSLKYLFFLSSLKIRLTSLVHKQPTNLSSQSLLVSFNSLSRKDRQPQLQNGLR